MANTGGVYVWSQTASSNATADATVNYSEGQAPSSLNDSARAAMASVAKWRDDIAGAIVTGGTSTAYTVSSYEVFDTLAHMSGQMIAFTPHTTSGATVTLNVDSLGAKPLRSAPSLELPAGVLVQGTPYLAIYNNSDGAFYLQGFFGNPYNIPIAGGLDYWGTTAPNSSFAFPSGQAVSRTTYATLFGILGTNFGSGDGSTTFNLPDKRGRVSAAADDMNGTHANRLSAAGVTGAMNGGTLSAVGGEQVHTLTIAEMPAHNHTINDPGHTHGNNTLKNNTDTISGAGAGFAAVASEPGTINSATTGITINNNGSGNSHNVVQPTIVCNYIMRII